MTHAMEFMMVSENCSEEVLPMVQSALNHLIHKDCPSGSVKCNLFM